MNEFFKIKGNKILLKVHINPNAKKNEVAGIYNNSLKIKISSPAVDGKANKALIEFLSKFLNISKSKIKIERGDKSREKIISIDDSSNSIIKKLQEVGNANL
jgi:uncharacterized protein (TIGR00251 family)